MNFLIETLNYLDLFKIPIGSITISLKDVILIPMCGWFINLIFNALGFLRTTYKSNKSDDD